MAGLETVAQDSQSYRRGLVLGLTLAEVMLLLVFALLIALATLWRHEHQKKPVTALRIKNEIMSVVDNFKPEQDSRALDAIRQIERGQALESLTRQEREFVTEARHIFEGQRSSVIDDNWKALTRAAHTARDLQRKLDYAAALDVAPWDVKQATVVWPEVNRAKGQHNWPPIIRLKEAEGYYFAVGSAALPDRFQQQLNSKVVPQLITNAKDYDVDIIEVIGHTDEQAIAPRPSNLDKQLLDAAKGTAPIETVIPGDNAGLGLARAVAVVRALTADGRLHNYRILPFSAGQLVGTDDVIAAGTGGDVKERRRIEIRLRRSQQ